MFTGYQRVMARIMSLFYKSNVESVISYSIISWFGPSSKQDQNKLSKIIRIAKRMGVTTASLYELYEIASMRMLGKVLNDNDHPLNQHYVFLRCGRRLNVQSQCTTRYKNTFVPSSIKLYNFKRK
jgi:uncharacterized 2Fe-2S/4Fe-4S cluster protein (DUF4445 family)